MSIYGHFAPFGLSFAPSTRTAGRPSSRSAANRATPDQVDSLGQSRIRRLAWSLEMGPDDGQGSPPARCAQCRRWQPATETPVWG